MVSVKAMLFIVLSAFSVGGRATVVVSQSLAWRLPGGRLYRILVIQELRVATGDGAFVFIRQTSPWHQ